MFNFFADASIKRDNCYYISGSDFNHIKNVLRMKVGDEILVSCDGESDLCVLREFSEDTAVAEITEESFQNTELPIKIYLFEGLPKGDKMELIIQKCVELGVHAVVPTEMSRCVVKLDDKKKKSKISRWQSISESAAKQSKRNTVPEIMNVMSYKEALLFAEKLDLFLGTLIDYFLVDSRYDVQLFIVIAHLSFPPQAIFALYRLSFRKAACIQSLRRYRAYARSFVRDRHNNICSQT